MQSADRQNYTAINKGSLTPLREIAIMAVLSAAAAALQIAESPLPRIFPWLKPGLANILTLFAIIKISSKAGIMVSVVRTFIAGIFLGTILSPVYFISFAGALSSALVMSIIKKLQPDAGLSTVSVSGALASNGAQLLTVQFMFASEMSYLFHIAIMIWVAIPSGLIVAKATSELIRRS